MNISKLPNMTPIGHYSIFLASWMALYANPANSETLGVLGEVANPTTNQTAVGNAISTACQQKGNTRLSSPL